jgi:hypothetical protein
MTSDTEAVVARVTDLLSAAESFARAADFTGACARAREALGEAARADEPRRGELHALAALALGRHEASLAAWQAASSGRLAAYLRSEGVRIGRAPSSKAQAGCRGVAPPSADPGTWHVRLLTPTRS